MYEIFKIFYKNIFLDFIIGSRKKRDRDRDRDRERERERERSVNNLALSGFQTNILKFPKIPLIVNPGQNGSNSGIPSVATTSTDPVVRYVRAQQNQSILFSDFLFSYSVFHQFYLFCTLLLNLSPSLILFLCLCLSPFLPFFLSSFLPSFFPSFLSLTCFNSSTVPVAAVELIPLTERLMDPNLPGPAHFCRPSWPSFMADAVVKEKVDLSYFDFENIFII